MSKRLTVSNALAVVALGGLALVLAGCLTQSGAALPADATSEPTGITVEGEGRAPARADKADLRFAILRQGLTAEEAGGRTAEARELLLKRFSELGIAPEEVVSVQLTVHQGPDVPATPVPSPTPAQWRAFQTVSITVALVPNGQELAAALVAGGATDVRLLTDVSDRVRAAFDLDGQGENTAKAQEEVSRKSESISKALAARGLNVMEMKVTSARASPLSTLQDTSQRGNPTYVAWHIMKVSTGRLDLLPQIAAAIAPLGQVENVTYGISGLEALQARAREASLEDARKKAEDIAGRTGAKVGKVINVAEVSSRPPTNLATPAPGLLVSVPPLRSFLNPPEDVMVVRLRVTYSIK